VVDRASGMALTATTATFRTIGRRGNGHRRSLQCSDMHDGTAGGIDTRPGCLPSSGGRTKAERALLCGVCTHTDARMDVCFCIVIWSLVHTKGGVAKTTTAMFLAAAAARRGVPVRVVDADPQGSASSWADRAAHLGMALPFDVIPATAASLRELSSEPGELVLVDTPPGTAAAIDAAIDVADLVIIPTGPRAADIDRVWPTLDITQHRPTTILLTLVDMRKVEAAEMPRSLAEANAPVLRNIVRNLTAIERAFGRGIPRYLGDYGDVYDELMAAGLERGVTV
jgi:chromosome partitioning protein